jgi:hypothetical protein
MFILDIEPFFHQAVRGPDTVALMRSIGLQQIKQASGAGHSLTSDPRIRGHVIGWAGRRSDFCSGPTTNRSSNTYLVAAWATKRESGRGVRGC